VENWDSMQKVFGSGQIEQTYREIVEYQEHGRTFQKAINNTRIQKCGTCDGTGSLLLRIIDDGFDKIASQVGKWQDCSRCDGTGVEKKSIPYKENTWEIVPTVCSCCGGERGWHLTIWDFFNANSGKGHANQIQNSLFEKLTGRKSPESEEPDWWMY
jgi:hypothetical protein